MKARVSFDDDEEINHSAESATESIDNDRAFKFIDFTESKSI